MTNQIHKLTVGTFETELGQRYLKELIRAFVDRPIYKQGQSLEETAYRQGQCDLVRQIMKELDNGNR